MKVLIKPGHIRLGIDRTVHFEYYELPEPNPTDFWSNNWRAENPAALWKQEFKEYESSKRLIKVSNKTYPVGKDIFIDIHKGLAVFVGSKITNNQPCKAEVTGDTCTIVELINILTTN